MKKFICIVVSIMMIMSLVACSNKTDPTKEADATEAETTLVETDVESTDVESTEAETPLKVALVVNQPFGDKGSMDDLAAGADRAAEDFGVEVAKLESDTATFEDDIRAMCQQGYNLIITTFYYMSDATMTVAKEYPDVQFCAVYQAINTGDEKYDNIWSIEFHGEQAFYVTGYMAGLYTKTGHVGIMVGGEEPSPKAEANGFLRGVLDATGRGVVDANPNPVGEFAYAGGYGDPATAKEKALAMIANGCDFIQNDSGASNAGVVEAANENNILTAGEITDYWDTCKNFIGIIGIGFGNVAYEAIQTAVDGTFKGGEYSVFGLAEGGYVLEWETYERFAEEHEDFVEVISQGKEIEKKIVNGDIVITYDTEDPSWENTVAKYGTN